LSLDELIFDEKVTFEGIVIGKATEYGCMPTVQADSHRGRVCQALSTRDWMDCYDVADATGYTVDGSSSVLSDVYRAGYVHRRAAKEGERVEYEYQLKTNVSVR
jgi:hypothetical protein